MKKYVISFLLIFCLSVLCVSSNFFVNTYAIMLDESAFTAKSLYLIDYNSGQVLYEKDAEKQLPVASIVFDSINICPIIQNTKISSSLSLT